MGNFYKEPYTYNNEKDDDAFHSLKKKIIGVIILGFMVITGYNGYIAYNMKDDNELMRQEISKANTTYDNIKILNARIQNLERNQVALSNCVDYLELQFISNKDTLSRKSVEFYKYKEKCQNSVIVSYNNKTKNKVPR